MSREAFEAACFDYYLERIKAGKIPPESRGFSANQLFWRKEDGTYGVEMFNAAWFGWEARAKFTDHVLYKTGDTDAPDFIKDRNGEVVLGECKVCGLAEVQLDQQPVCPGAKNSLLDKLNTHATAAQCAISPEVAKHHISAMLELVQDAQAGGV